MSTLQLYSFVLDENTIDDVELYVFKLPNGVKTRIEKIREMQRREYKSVAAKAMFKVAVSIFDTVIHSNNSLNDICKDNNNWFYSLEEFDLELLEVKVKEWISKEQENVGLEVDVDFDEEWSFSEKTTLKEVLKTSNAKYNIIPRYYIYKLAKEEFEFDTLEKNLKFNRVIDDSKATMITMPIKIENRKYTPFSYAIEVTLKDVIDSDKLTLHFYLKIKKWEFSNRTKDGNLMISSRENTSVYVYNENQYYSDKDIIFNKISVKKQYKKNEIFYDNTADRIYCEMMNLDIVDALGKIEEYNEKSAIYLVGFKNRNTGNISLTQASAGLPERNEMIRLVSKKLHKLILREPINYVTEDKFSKTKSIPKEDVTQYGLDKFITTKSGKKDLPKDIYISPQNIRRINMMLVTSKDELVNMIIPVMRYYFKLDKEVDKMKYKNEDDLEVKFNVIDNAITRALDEGEKVEDRRIELETLISNSLHNEALNLAIVDIERFDEKKGYENKDPKQVIRVALKNKKVLSQFISFKADTAIDVVLNTVRDIISSASFQEAALFSSKGIAETDILLGVDMVSTANSEKRIGLSKIENGITYVRLYPERNWVEVKDYIYSITKKKLQDTKIKMEFSIRAKIEQWIEDVIAEEMMLGKMVYCFVDCVLRGNGWSYITNGKFLNFDALRIAGKERLRVIRINSTDEIPDYYITDKKGSINKNKGIFKSDKNTYYLVGGRIDTDSSVGNYVTKIDYPCKSLRRPSLYEVNIQGAITEEEECRIAVMTQNLRKMNITYNKESSAPLPLYSLGRLSEYLIAENSLK